MRIAPIAVPAPTAVGKAASSTAEPRQPFSTFMRSPEAGLPPGPELPAGPLGQSIGQPVAPPAGPTWAHHALTSLLEDERRVDVGLRAAMRGDKLDAQALLILQARVGHYTQEVDLASRLVDKATAAVKQIFQIQL